MSEKANVFVLHCGLDLKKLQRCCKKLDLAVNLIPFRREEVFSYYVRLDRPRPDLIVIRSHFNFLVNSLNEQKCIPIIVVSTHQKPTDCLAPFIQADEGYEGLHASNTYVTLALTMRQQLSSGANLAS
ncbi:MAG: hypothetical protein P8X67_02650 [Syntrophobacterales bacterium]|jgi:hypothetical protein